MGELLICDYAAGGLWRLAPNPATGTPSKFPRKLSETGLYADAARQDPAPGVMPYAINAPRWADHATAERWVAFPGLSRLATDDDLGYPALLGRARPVEAEHRREDDEARLKKSA